MQGDEQTLRLLAEEPSVSRRQVEGDTVHVRTVTHLVDWPVDEALTHERVEVERVRIGREVDAVPAVRQEGDLTIMPVVEEVAVVVRRLILTEEVRIRRVHVVEHHRETVPLRQQEAVITRTRASEVRDQHAALSQTAAPSQPLEE
jgi:stress response protein YsnF